MTYTATANNFSVDRHFAQTYLIQMPSRFTAIEASNVEQQFQEICQNRSAFNKIICDFGQTLFMDSSGLVGLCQIIKLSQRKGVALAFSSFSPQKKIIFSLTGLDKYLQKLGDF